MEDIKELSYIHGPHVQPARHFPEKHIGSDGQSVQEVNEPDRIKQAYVPNRRGQVNYLTRGAEHHRMPVFTTLQCIIYRDPLGACRTIRINSADFRTHEYGEGAMVYHTHVSDGKNLGTGKLCFAI